MSLVLYSNVPNRPLPCDWQFDPGRFAGADLRGYARDRIVEIADQSDRRITVLELVNEQAAQRRRLGDALDQRAGSAQRLDLRVVLVL